MNLFSWDSAPWRQLKTVFDLSEIDGEVSLFHYVNDVIWLFLTYFKDIYLILKQFIILLRSFCFWGEIII